MHRDEDHLRQIYKRPGGPRREMRGRSDRGFGDFLAKVRVNITAANRLRRRVVRNP